MIVGFTNANTPLCRTIRGKQTLGAIRNSTAKVDPGTTTGFTGLSRLPAAFGRVLIGTGPYWDTLTVIEVFHHAAFRARSAFVVFRTRDRHILRGTIAFKDTIDHPASIVAADLSVLATSVGVRITIGAIEAILFVSGVLRRQKSIFFGHIRRRVFFN